jgi:hypothetical protein
MSVLVRNKATEECYVFAKGAPELVHFYSQNKCQGFDNIIKDLSLKGFKTVAVSFKKIDAVKATECFSW